jgi:glucose-6-phosphate 1-epimerase
MVISGEFPKILSATGDGAQAEIYLHGGHITSWHTPEGRERLFLSPKTAFGHSAALRGGIPVVFPQFSGNGPLIKHGFARLVPWECTGTQTNPSGTATTRFKLRETDETRTIWDHAFQLDLAVTVGGAQLEIAMQAANTGALPFGFTAALHTYLHVNDLAAVRVEGLEGRPYREFGVDYVQPDAPLTINGEVDRIYWNVPGPVTMHDVDQTIQVVATGFPDAVVWNPGPEKCATLVDMEPEGYRHMLCIEAVAIGQPVTLAPGASWSGAQTLTML